MNIPHFLPEIGFVSEPVVLAHVGMGSSSWRKLVKAGDAPQPIKLSERMTRYDAAAVRAWIAERSKRPAPAHA